MALSVALPLAGLETENSFSSFSSFGHIIDIAGLAKSQSSPSPSASSESSGIGSLGSLKSESVNSDSLPSSPQTTEKKLFEPIIPQPRPVESKPDDVKVTYGGRDLLNLMGNLRDERWSYRATELPPNNPALFFANRSQYHRLGPYGTRTQYVKDSCRLCGFSWVVAATE